METVAAAAKGRGLREDQKRPKGDWKFPVLKFMVRSKCQASTEQGLPKSLLRKKGRLGTPSPIITAVIFREPTHFQDGLGW